MLGQVFVHVLAESLRIVEQLERREIGLVDRVGQLFGPFLLESTNQQPGESNGA
jgi:hypothetical protein